MIDLKVDIQEFGDDRKFAFEAYGQKLSFIVSVSFPAIPYQCQARCRRDGAAEHG